MLLNEFERELMKRLTGRFGAEFVRRNRGGLEVLLEWHRVPPRRTFVDLSHDVILVSCQPTNVTKGMEVSEFPFTDEGIGLAMKFLELRRILADAKFDSPNELTDEECADYDNPDLSDEERARRKAAYEARQAQTAAKPVMTDDETDEAEADEDIPDNVIRMPGFGGEAEQQAAVQ